MAVMYRASLLPGNSSPEKSRREDCARGASDVRTFEKFAEKFVSAELQLNLFVQSVPVVPIIHVGIGTRRHGSCVRSANGLTTSLGDSPWSWRSTRLS